METRTLQTPLPEHLDFDQLRAQALSRLQAFAGDRWTDYNAHDPGLTLLEALCYALTDLGYRAGYAMPDLLAGEIGSFYAPEQALPGAPVSHNDLLRGLYALNGAVLARLDALQGGEQQPELYYYPDSAADGAIGMEFFAGAEPVALQGLYRAAAAWASEEPTKSVVKAKDLWHGLQTARGLCTDIAGDVQTLSHEEIPLYLTLDLAPSVGDAGIFTRDLLKRLAQHIARLPQWQAGDNRPAGVPAEVWQEQSLEGGYLSPEALAQLQPREGIYASDIAQWLMDQPGVDNVRRISFEKGTIALVKLVSPDKAPVLDITTTAKNLKLLQKGRALEIQDLQPDVLETALARLVEGGRLPASTINDFPSGRDRHIGHYHSIRYDLPELYGLSYGTEGLPPAQAARRRQLSAYLLFFEQALAGQFAQLDYGRRLFDLQKDVPGHTYARPDLAGIPLANEVLADSYQESEASPGERLQRLYDHLLARVGEQVYVQEPEKKLHFLKNWPEWSAKRGLGFDYTKPEPDSQFYLEERIAALLGLEANERFYLVENILLRAMPDDQPDDEGNWLVHVPLPDPYSLRISCVLPDAGGRFVKSGEIPDEDFRSFVCRIIREEVPAHIAIDWLWLDGARMTAFSDAWQSFRTALSGSGNVLDPRISRDAVLDQLYDTVENTPQFLIGWPAPLLDIPVRQIGFAEPGDTAQIRIAYSQPGAIYVLCDRNGNMLNTIYQIGNGGSITLETHALVNDQDTTFCIKVIKVLPGVDPQSVDPDTVLDKNQRSGFLRRKVRIRVGIQTNLTLRWLPGGTTSLSDPLMIPYGERAGVRVEQVQAEVEYFLINDDGAYVSEGGSERGVQGSENGNVDIYTRALQDDVRVRVLARRWVTAENGSGEQPFEIINQQAEEGWIFVGANPDIEFGVIGPIEYGSTARPFLRQTQPGVQYTLQYREVVDAEFVHQRDLQAIGTGIGRMWYGLPNLPPALLRRNNNNYGWLIQNVTTLEGNGSQITADVADVREDSWFFVNAEKTHQGPNGPVLGNMVSLSRVPLVFVYPNKDLAFPQEEVTLAAGERLEIPLTNPQPGVFYRLVNLDNNNASIGPEVYRHDTDLSSPRRDGIGLMDLQFYSNNLPAQLGSKVGVDFVVGPPQSGEALVIGSDPLPAAPAQMQVGILARKAQTGLWVLLEGGFTLRIEGSFTSRSVAPAEVPPPPPARKPRKKKDS
jgi:hypothetical protein